MGRANRTSRASARRALPRPVGPVSAREWPGPGNGDRSNPHRRTPIPRFRSTGCLGKCPPRLVGRRGSLWGTSPNNPLRFEPLGPYPKARRAFTTRTPSASSSRKPKARGDERGQGPPREVSPGYEAGWQEPASICRGRRVGGRTGVTARHGTPTEGRQRGPGLVRVKNFIKFPEV
jgi:hypothetical protein